MREVGQGPEKGRGSVGTENLFQLLRSGPGRSLRLGRPGVKTGGCGIRTDWGRAGLRGEAIEHLRGDRSHGLQQEACRRPHSGYALTRPNFKPPHLGKKVQALDSLTLETANQQVLLNTVEVVGGVPRCSRG